MQVEFVHDGATLVSEGGGTIRYWDVQSGEAKEGEAGEGANLVKSVLEGRKFEFSKGSSLEQKVGKFLLTAEGDILRIFKSEVGVTDKADKDKVPVAFFRTPAPIFTVLPGGVDTSGEHITVGCHNGDVLQLRAAVLLTGCNLFLTIFVSSCSSCHCKRRYTSRNI
jgi:hypothetical protein